MFTDKRYHYYDISFYYDKIKIEDNRMKEVFIKGSLDYIIRKLYEYRKNGEHVFCMYEGIRLDSDSISSEASMIASSSVSEEDYDNLSEKEQEEILEKMLKENREKYGASPITKDLVVSGLKYISEHQNESQYDMVKGLLELGCNFDFMEIHKYDLDDRNDQDLKKISEGASIIYSVLAYPALFETVTKVELEWSGDLSVYGLIRKLTGEDYYTRDYVMNMLSGQKRR